MTNIERLTQGTSNDNPSDDDQYEELWHVRLSGSQDPYELSKSQARVLMEEIAHGNRGIIPFSTFVLPINFIVEFYRVKRFLKGAMQLPERATEEPYKPISPERLEEIRRKVYEKVGKSLPSKK